MKGFTTASHHLKDYFKPKSFIFDILNPKDLSDLQIYRDINQAVKAISKYMKRIAQDLKFERVLTTNCATFIFDCFKHAGDPTEMISEYSNLSGRFESDQKREITKFLTAFQKK